jgi:sulfate transport system substrate-binding protein
MWSKTLIGLAVLAVVGAGAWLVFGSNRGGQRSSELLNVSYDPTRELWRDLNARFIPAYEKETGTRLDIKQSHGGSGTQARAVADGLEADVVTLALWGDTDLLRQKGLIAAGWEERLPNQSLPYTSTIVFVVRKGNPHNIHDWPDLLQEGVQVITPNPKTSGNGKLSFLAAWGAVLRRGGSEKEALAFVTWLYRHAPVLDSGARGATTTFAQKKIGDVHLTWENEAYLEVEEAPGELELVYPPMSIRAEPYVAVVDANVDRKGTRAAAEKYLQFLYTQEAQEIIAQHHYRPSNADVLKKHPELREVDLFPVSTVARDWGEAQQKFFADGGVFDGIYKPEGK